jgi:hypothetical protein
MRWFEARSRVVCRRSLGKGIVWRVGREENFDRMSTEEVYAARQVKRMMG